MATVAAARPLRSALAGLTGDAERDLSKLWRRVEDAASAETALRDVLPAIVETYGAAAATLAAEWYDDLRAKAGVAGSFQAIPVEPTDRGAQALIGWALDEATDLPSFQSLIVGGTQRRISDHARLTSSESAVADPKAHGWQRTGAGECGFCSMLISRGAVYSEAAADFGAHDHCQCQAVPAFEGAARPVKPFTPTNRNITDADRARVRAWIASN